ncbi:MAG: methionyl-tRNA formyltransferase [Anaerolineaceae bacterium]|nr:methionyl-tRNA formyltransferase [Anaerolineaceae bacterium]
MEKLKIVFMGSPEIAVPALKALAEHFDVVGVVTQPDREAGRGKKIVMPAVKEAALALNIPVIQPERMKVPGTFEQLEAWAPDLIVVMAFGQILRKNVLGLPRLGCLNAHASLLPRWRGASPIQAAILNGDTVSGVTIMQMDPGIDTGPMLKSQALPIEPYDTTVTLSAKMADLAAELLLETIPAYAEGTLLPQPQPEEGACYTGMISKQDGMLDFSQSADALVCKVHAYNPWPTAMVEIDGQNFKVYQAHRESNGEQLKPGSRTIFRGLPAIAAADGLLVLDELQAPGKKAMPGKAFLAGFRSWNQE